MTEHILQAYNVLDEIKENPIYQEIKKLNQEMLDLYPKEIDAFQTAKTTYEDVMQTGGSYHPDFKQTVQKFSQAKLELYSKEEVKRYFKLEKQFQDEINQFLQTLTDSVSSHIAMPDILGITKKGKGGCHVR